MKRFVVFLTGCLLALPALGQAAFPTESNTHGGFGAPVVKVSTINEQTAWLVGVHGGWMARVAPRHTLAFGLGAYGVMTDVTNDTGQRLGLDYGGLELGYLFRTSRYLQLTAGTLIGAGNIAYDSPDDDADGLLVLEPEVGLQVPLARFMRLSSSAGYRYVGGVDLDGLDAAALRGATGTVALTLGRF